MNDIIDTKEEKFIVKADYDNWYIDGELFSFGKLYKLVFYNTPCTNLYRVYKRIGWLKEICFLSVKQQPNLIEEAILKAKINQMKLWIYGD